jgi:hypothetical protein
LCYPDLLPAVLTGAARASHVEVDGDAVIDFCARRSRIMSRAAY